MSTMSMPWARAQRAPAQRAPAERARQRPGGPRCILAAGRALPPAGPARPAGYGPPFTARRLRPAGYGPPVTAQLVLTALIAARMAATDWWMSSSVVDQ